MTLTTEDRMMDDYDTYDAIGLAALVAQGEVCPTALLDTALEGIRAVADRVSALRRVRDTLETYDQTGRKTTFESMHKGRVEKRA